MEGERKKNMLRSGRVALAIMMKRTYRKIGGKIMTMVLRRILSIS